MSHGQHGLGRGIGALIPGRPGDQAVPEEEPAASASAPGMRAVPGASFAELPVDSIRPNARQPRSVFDADELAELVASVRAVGLLQPIVVRRDGAGSYELIMGERRWRAVQAAELTTIPAIVRDTTDDGMLRDALLENLHRSQLNALEEAAAYQQLLDDFGCTHEELAERIGRSRPHISNTIRLLRLSPHVQRRVAAGVLSAGHARALLAVDDGTEQDRLAAKVVAEGLSVRGAEELVALRSPAGTVRSARRPAELPAGFGAVAERLADRLETRVVIQRRGSRGRIVVDFADADDLLRIAATWSPE